MRCSLLLTRVLNLRVSPSGAQGSAFLIAVVAILLALGLPISPVQSQQIIHWNNTFNFDSYYSFGSNWVGNSAPASIDTARFNQSAAYEVWWDTSTPFFTPNVGALDVLQGNVSFLNVAGGAQHEFTVIGPIGSFTVSGAGTTLTNRGLHLIALHGGQLTGGATLTLDGSHARGARLTVASSAGFDASGNLNVNSGAIFDNTIGYIGRLSGSTGLAKVTGVGSRWNNGGSLYIGGSSTSAGGTGSLSILDDGLVSVLGTTKLWSGGSVVLDRGGALNTQTLDLASGSFEMLNGGTLHAEIVLGDLVNESGTLAPGMSPGMTTVSGNYTQNAGTLQIELGGPAANQVDKLKVTGILALGGALNVSVINNFVPLAGNSFDILDWGTLSGTFATLNLPGGGLTWNTSQLYNTGVLSVGGVVGDYNHNGTVDAADYVVWRVSLGQTGAGLAADGNFNNVIDAGDLAAWRAHFGQSAGSGSGAASANAAVPEPATLMLVLFAASGACLRCRRGA